MAETISKRSIVYDILFEVEKGKKSAKDAEKALKDLGKSAEQTGESFTSLGKQIFASLTVQQLATEAVRAIGQFTREAFELGLKVEGVRKAFTQLNNPKLLDNLREATRGTVDDFVLMQSAVKADKFKIPLTQLATLFDFARRRAKETGQEVGFLTESIIDGIGRKSPLILDNLGLRAQDLQNEFKKTGDFATAAANVIAEEMRTSGAEISTNAERVQQLRTQWQNFKIDVGNALVDSVDEVEAFLTGPISGNKKIFDAIFNLAADNIGILDQLREKWAAQAEEARRAGQQMNAAMAGAAIFGRLFNTSLNTTEFSLKEIQDRLVELNIEFAETTDPNVRKELATQILRFQEMEAAIKKLLEPAKKVAEIFKGITQLKTFVPKELTTELQQATNELYLFAKAWDEVTNSTSNWIALADGTLIKGTIPQVEGGLKSTSTLWGENAEAVSLYTGALSSSMSSLAGIAKEGSAAQIALSEISILASYAQSIASAIAGATASGAATGPAALFTTPSFVATLVASTVAAFAASFANLQKAKSLQSGGGSVNAVAFAEGEVDIHRSGETRGKDSIPAVIMPGESVIRTDRTSQYKPELQAIQAGNLEELIRVNYVEPALAMQALDSSVSGAAAPDYSDRLYRQYLLTGEGNMSSKRMVRYLASIDKKLTPADKRYSR